MTDPHYKRGTIRKDGKLYGRYPDGSLYRIYSTTDLSYPSSALRRSRTVGGGKLVNALTAASGGICVFVEL